MKIVDDASYEREQAMVEARQIAIAFPVLEPMILRRREAVIKRLISTYREGMTKIELIAELSMLEGFQHELKVKMQNLQAEER